MTLQELINKHIFESYEVVTKVNLDNEIKTVSILETTDFKDYIQDSALILTTFYLIQQNVNLFQDLMQVLVKAHTAGIVIKANRYAEEIPEKIIQSCNKNGIPIILLHYDISLSSLFASIYSELQTDDYLQHNFHVNFTDCMEMIQKNPSAEVLIESVKKIPHFDAIFYDYLTGEIHTTSDSLLPYINNDELADKQLFVINEHIFYKEDIKYNDKNIYQMVICSDNQNRNVIHTYTEIFRILIEQVFQRKTDLSMHLDNFLMNFVMNFTSSSSTNQDIIEEGKIYNWRIEFPLIIVLITSKTTKKDLPNHGVLVNQLKTDFIREFDIQFEEVKYISFQNKVTFLLNTKYNSQESTNKLRQLIDSDPVYNDFLFAITKPIDEAENIPTQYRHLLDASSYIESNNPSTSFIPPDFIDFFRIIRSMDKNSLNSLVKDMISPLLEYEESHSIPLIKTLLVYIQCHFNIQQASKALYIHYNTLKYRLNIIKELGYDINENDYQFLPLYMSLYLYDIGLTII